MSYKKFVQSIGLLGITQIVAALGGLITLPIITKLLGAENYGIWVQLMVTLGLISTFANLEIPYALVRFLSGEKDLRQIRDGIWSAFVVLIVALTAISAALILFSGDISRFFGCPQFFIFILAVTIFFDCLNFLLANVLRMFQEVKKFSYLSIAENILEPALIILAVMAGYGLLGALLSLLLIRMVFFIIMITYIVRRVGVSMPQFLKTKPYISFCLPLIPTDISYWVIQSSDKYFVGFFLGTLFVGYYAPAYTLGCCISFLIMPLGFLLPVILSKHHDENELETVKTYLRYSLRYFLMISVPAVFGLSILSKQLLTTFSTPQIAAHSYFVVPFSALSMLLYGTCVILAQNISLKKKTKTNGAIWLAGALLNIGLNFIFVPRFGILGAAITTLVAYAFITAAVWHYSFKELAFTVDWNIIVKTILASLVMSAAIFSLNPRGLWQDLATIVLGVATYGVALASLRGVNRHEFAFFGSLLRGE